MPVLNNNNLGYSSSTPKKQDCFKNFLRAHIKIAFNVMLKHYSYVYRYYDINAGCGEYEGIRGSPLMFLETIDSLLLPDEICIDAVFVEENSANVDKLKLCFTGRRELPKNVRFKIICDDNKKILPNYRGNGYGLLYHDPNGCFDHELLTIFAKQNPKLDILINCNSTAIKRSHAALNTENLVHRIDKIGKRNWFIRDVFGHHQWTFLFGCNWTDFPVLRNIGFHNLFSRAGLNIFERVSLTPIDREKKRQNFFDFGWPSYNDYLTSSEFAKVKKERFALAGGKCEICGDIATEPHHKIYADWRNGDVDKVDNLIVVCHACHCKIHGKEN